MSATQPHPWCGDCDEDNRHPWIPGQRRTVCDLCGYESHWVQGTYLADLQAVVVNNGFYADWRDGEYMLNGDGEGLKNGQCVRITLCCYGAARADLRRVRRKSVTPHCPACGADGDTQTWLGELGRLVWYRCRNCGLEHYNPRDEQ